MNTPAWRMRLAAYLLVVAMFAVSIWRVEQLRLHDQAQNCVAQWERAAQIRNMGETVYRRENKTLLIFARNARPDLLVAFREQIARDVVEIRAKLHDPSCDINAAKRRLR